MKTSNIYADLPAELHGEWFEKIIGHSSFALERIISRGHATPRDMWYDQEKDEWVILLKGSAGLLIEGERAPRILTPGDYLLLPAHARHRIEWTDATTETIWLALHF